MGAFGTACGEARGLLAAKVWQVANRKLTRRAEPLDQDPAGTIRIEVGDAGDGDVG